MRAAVLFLLAFAALLFPKGWNAIKGADSHLFSKNLRTENYDFNQTKRSFERFSSEAAIILAQPFYYWGKGSQFYVYLSDDGAYVLKIPRASKQRQSLLDRLMEREVSKPDLLRSLQIAYENLALQTGLIAVHLDMRDEILIAPVKLFDRLNRSQMVDMKSFPFAVQKRQMLLSSALAEAANSEATKRILMSYLNLILLEAKKGWMSYDCAFWLNFGIENNEARRLDVGSYVALDESFSLSKAVKPVVHWLKKNDPLLVGWFEQEIEWRKLL